MNIIEVQEKLATIKGGTYYKLTYQSVKGEYVKITNTTVRNVRYGAVKGVETQGKVNPNDTYECLNLITNAKTGKTRLQVFLTKHHKAHSTYYHKLESGEMVEITKEEFLMANPSEVNKPRPTIMFSVLIDNIIKIGE